MDHQEQNTESTFLGSIRPGEYFYMLAYRGYSCEKADEIFKWVGECLENKLNVPLKPGLNACLIESSREELMDFFTHEVIYQVKVKAMAIQPGEIKQPSGNIFDEARQKIISMSSDDKDSVTLSKGQKLIFTAYHGLSAKEANVFAYSFEQYQKNGAYIPLKGTDFHIRISEVLTSADYIGHPIDPEYIVKVFSEIV